MSLAAPDRWATRFTRSVSARCHVLHHVDAPARFRCTAPITVRCLQGRIWVTRTGHLADHFLDAGEAMTTPAGSECIVSAEPCPQSPTGVARVEIVTLADSA